MWKTFLSPHSKIKPHSKQFNPHDHISSRKLRESEFSFSCSSIHWMVCTHTHTLRSPNIWIPHVHVISEKFTHIQQRVNVNLPFRLFVHWRVRLHFGPVKTTTCEAFTFGTLFFFCLDLFWFDFYLTWSTSWVIPKKTHKHTHPYFMPANRFINLSRQTDYNNGSVSLSEFLSVFLVFFLFSFGFICCCSKRKEKPVFFFLLLVSCLLNVCLGFNLLHFFFVLSVGCRAFSSPIH